jgi:hypothetical protein
MYSQYSDRIPVASYMLTNVRSQYPLLLLGRECLLTTLSRTVCEPVTQDDEYTTRQACMRSNSNV